MDDRFRTNPFPDFTSSSFDKFRKLSSALLVLHSGSTIGLEACLLGVPSLLVDFGYGKKRSGLSVYGFIHQFQNEKYLLQQGLGLRQPSDLCHVLRNPEEIQQKSKRVATSFPLTSLLEISERLLN
jgi:hypothetical protein